MKKQSKKTKGLPPPYKEYKTAFNFSPKHNSCVRPIIAFNTIGAGINSVTPGELFWQYAKVGFLYPNKKRKLTPYIELVEENWRKALKLGEEIFWIASVIDRESKSWASICNWRTTLTGWVSQHLVSSGNVAYPLLLMLGTQIKVMREADVKPYGSFQNWFRPTNKYANKVFGFLAKSISKESTELEMFQYFMLDRKAISNPSDAKVSILKCTNKNSNGIEDYFKSKKSDQYLSAEELIGGDLELHALNEIYKKVGLERRRSLWLAEGAKGEPLGAIITYHAPIGLNFSMLENRCEIILNNNLSAALAATVCVALLNTVQADYDAFPATFIPLVSNASTAQILTSVGVNAIRSYNQFIWLKDGYQDWYNALWDIGEHSINRWLRTHKIKDED